MIEVSVNPDEFIAGRPAQLTIRLANTGVGTCSNVVFRLRLPPGIALVSGPDKIAVEEIATRQVHAHRVTVLPGRPGDAEVGTSNFSYRDEDGIKRRQDEWRASIRVLPAGRSGQPSASTPPRLTVRLGAGKLALGAWEVLEIFLHNATGVALHDVTVTLACLFQVDPPAASGRIVLLRDGETGRAAFNLLVPDRGKVPVTIQTTYRYQDEQGHPSMRAQDDRVTVEVATPAETAPHRNEPDKQAPVTSVLYLVAQPFDLPALASYREMREVETLLQLGRHRERFRLEHCVAARLRNITQALGDHCPQIVHFSGHGRDDGSLAVENDRGLASYVNPAGLAKLIGGFASVQCVIVNACYSVTLAEAMSEKIDYVVGMRSEILDLASVQFSVGFYQGLFAGKAYPDAFEQGVALVQADPATNSQYLEPILLARRGA